MGAGIGVRVRWRSGGVLSSQREAVRQECLQECKQASKQAGGCSGCALSSGYQEALTQRKTVKLVVTEGTGVFTLS